MPPSDDIRKRLDSITDRVNKNEQDYGDALKQIAAGQVQIKDIRLQIGSPPGKDGQGTGMAGDLAELRATVGTAPNQATGAQGTGMAGTLADVRIFVEEAKDLAAQTAAKPVDLLRKVQTVSAVIGTLVLVGTVFSGCAAALLWLFKLLPHILGQ